MKVQHLTETASQPAEGIPGVSVRWVIGKEDEAPNFAMRVFDVQPGAATPARLLDFPYAPALTDDDGDSVPDECSTTCPGDFDGSGIVGGEDLGELLGQFGLTGEGLVADLNGDEIVDGADLGLLFSLWGECG